MLVLFGFSTSQQHYKRKQFKTQVSQGEQKTLLHV